MNCFSHVAYISVDKSIPIKK